jgi:pimeloyl-ACP methyl ester carboxylesterase
MNATSVVRPRSPGPGKRKLTFVLVNGAFEAGSVWADVAEELGRLGHEVHAPTPAGPPTDSTDTAGTGTTGTTGGPDWLVAYLTENELTDVVLVGHSTTENLIADAAERAPEVIKKLVLRNAFVVADENDPRDATGYYELIATGKSRSAA